jgi:hypothetical protein
MRGLTLALLLAAVVAVSVRWGSFVAGGSDSYCYVYQAERWADAFTHPFGGRLQIAEPLALDAPWPDAALTFAPVGHIPSPAVPGAVAPICPPGLSLAMAPFVAVGGRRAAFAVIPLFAALLVLATYATGARFGARIGMGAALLTAASPVFLYQIVQPMSDVPSAALWLVAIASATGTGRRHALWSGLATSAAILMRPNLVPLGFAIGLFLLFRPERTWSARVRAALTYAMASAAGCLAVAVIQQTFFGSALSSGYGSLDALFATSHVAPNAQRYSTWLWQTHTPAIALAALSVFLLPGPLTTLFLALIAINIALYLPYTVFEDWSFLRFLLPTIPLLLILLVAVVDAMWRRWTPFRDGRRHGFGAQPAVAVVAVVLAVLLVREAIDRNAFRLQRLEARFERAGTVVGDRLPPNALVVTRWHSGSVRYYGNRKTLVWDALDPAWLDRAMAYLRSRGYEPYLMFEGTEEAAFRRRFAGSAIGRLDWPPAMEIGGQVRVFRPDDRQRYLKGNASPTEYLR